MHCIRLHPHYTDGSGFFVAVLEKREHRGFPVALPVGSPAFDSVLRLPWRARNDSNRYEVVTSDSPEVRALVDYYGLDHAPSPLLAEFNIKGRLTQLNLVNRSLLHFLRCHLNCKSSPLLIAVGVPLFKLLDENFMTHLDVPSRWRPALEGAAWLASRMSRRILHLDLNTMQKLLTSRVLPMQQLRTLEAEGSIAGLDSCGDLLGGAVVGLRGGSFWAPCIITGLGLELYANAEELGEPAPLLLPRARPHTICAGPGYAVLAKPSGLRNEDALRFVQEDHPAAELVPSLDKQTSGCLLVASSREGSLALSRQLEEGNVLTTYLALVWGCPEDAWEVDAPLSQVESNDGSRCRAVAEGKGKSKPASTAFKTLRRFSEGVALLQASAKTAWAHQIRCHLAHAGFPLVADEKYGGEAASWCTRLPLHCLRVHVVDVLGCVVDAFAPCPDDFAAMVATLDVSPAVGLEAAESPADIFPADARLCERDFWLRAAESKDRWDAATLEESCPLLAAAG
jgi:hypothetical protein